MRRHLPTTHSHNSKPTQVGRLPSSLSNTFINDQNSLVQSIRQKYSHSKQKNLFTLRRDDSSIQNIKIKQQPKQPLKQNTTYHTRSNTTLSITNQRSNSFFIKDINKDINKDIHRDINRSIQRSIQRSISRENINKLLNRSGSIQYEQMKQRQQKSKQKVEERLNNINLIRDKINNLINKYDIGKSSKSNLQPKESIDLNASMGRKGVIKRNINQKDSFKQSFINSHQKLNISRQDYKSKDSRSSSSSNLRSQSIFIQRQSLKKLDSNSYNDSVVEKQIDSRLLEYPLNKYSSTLPKSYEQYKSHKPIQSSLRSSTFNTSISSNSNTMININSNNSTSRGNSIKELVFILCTQIEYDQQLRISKYLFHLNPNQNKYSLLLKQFQRRGINYRQSQLQTQMKFSQHQYDPFMQDDTHQDYCNYADALISSNKYWKENIFRKFDYNILTKDDIKETLRSENDKIQVADLARFVSLNSTKLYKNRDLIIIMRRIFGLKADTNIKDVWRALCWNYE